MVVEGPLYIEISGRWEHCYCVIDQLDGSAPVFHAYERTRLDLPPSLSNRASIIVNFAIVRGECVAAPTTVSMAVLSKLSRNKAVPATPSFFNVKIREMPDESTTTYRFVTNSQEDRARWIDAIKARSKIRGTASPPRWASIPSPPQYATTAGPVHAALLVSRVPTSIMRSPPRRESPTKAKEMERDRADRRRRQKELYEHDPTPDDVLAPTATFEANTAFEMDLDGADDDAEGRILGTLKVQNVIRFFQVISVFPFAAILLALKTSTSSVYFVRSLVFVRLMNGLVFYAIPVVLVDVVMQRFSADAWVQWVTVGLHVLAMTALVLYVALGKLWAVRFTARVEDGTFSFKPSRTVRPTLANSLQIFGLLLDWLFCSAMVLPRGVIGVVPSAANISAVPPYLPYSVYLWTALALVLWSVMVIVLNGVLRGATLYRFQRARWVWYSFNVIGGPLFMTICTVLLMSHVCSRDGRDRLVLTADPLIACYSNRHIMLARAGLIGLTLYFLQLSLLPAATFKESIPAKLDVIYTPVYLSLNNAAKLAFCFFFVFFSDPLSTAGTSASAASIRSNETIRVVALSLLNGVFLGLGRALQPCSVAWVNSMQDLFCFHACIASVLSLNLLAWQDNHATNTLLLSTVVSIALFSSLLLGSLLLLGGRSAEHAVAASFLEIEWQVTQEPSSGPGCVSPRALEQLICVSTSADARDWPVAKKYVGQLVWLLSYPSLRVQFQAAWALANAALLDEQARIQIHDCDGVAALLSGYSAMQPMAQLEALAALANLTLSPRVAESMAKQPECIPFFMRLVRSNQTMHCVFSCVALGNLARHEGFRDAIRRAGGVQALVGCIMSQSYQKRKYGMFALANMALSTSKEIHALFQTRGLVERIMKMAERREADTQREVVALVRNLACHRALRGFLLDKGIMLAIQYFRGSVHADVSSWAETIAEIMEKEISSTGVMEVNNMSKRNRGEVVPGDEEEDALNLQKMQPLDGRVDWATWGSKLEQLFDPIFTSVPRPVDLPISTLREEPVIVSLATSLTKEAVHKWRDSVRFTIVSEPRHGVLDMTRMSASHCVTYAPHPGFTGKDKFAFRALLGPTVTPTAWVRLSVEAPASFDYHHANFGRRDDDDDDDDDAERFDARPPPRESYFDDEEKV